MERLLKYASQDDVVTAIELVYNEDILDANKQFGIVNGLITANFGCTEEKDSILILGFNMDIILCFLSFLYNPYSIDIYYLKAYSSEEKNWNEENNWNEEKNRKEEKIRSKENNRSEEKNRCDEKNRSELINKWELVREMLDGCIYTEPTFINNELDSIEYEEGTFEVVYTGFRLDSIEYNKFQSN